MKKIITGLLLFNIALYAADNDLTTPLLPRASARGESSETVSTHLPGQPFTDSPESRDFHHSSEERKQAHTPPAATSRHTDPSKHTHKHPRLVAPQSPTLQQWHIRLGYGEAPSTLVIDFSHRPTIKELTDKCTLFAMSLVNKELHFHPLESIYQYTTGPLTSSRVSGKKIYAAEITLTDKNIPNFSKLPVDIMVLNSAEQKEYRAIKEAWEKKHSHDVTLVKRFIPESQSPIIRSASPSSSSSAAAAASAAK